LKMVKKRSSKLAEELRTLIADGEESGVAPEALLRMVKKRLK
jgi:hypothetical protein